MTDTKDYNPQPFQSLTYPMDMSADNMYPEAICFSVHKRNGLSLADVSKSVKASFEELKAYNKSIGDASKGDPKNRDAEIEKIKDKWRRDHNNQEPPQSFVEQVGHGLKNVGDVRESKGLKAGKTTTELLGNIYMNMPNNIAYSEDANWGGQELGIVGTGVSNMIQGSGGGGDLLKGAGVGSIGTAASSGIGAALGGVAGKLGLGAILGALGGGAIQKGIEHSLSVAQNPYMEMMFSGVGFRSFSFEFNLRPRSEGEIEEVGKIIQMFRQHSRPSWVNHGMGKSFMEYPQEFHIKFLTMHHGSAGPSDSWNTNTALPALKPCVLSSVATNYTPQSMWTAFNNGSPVSTSLSLSFQETQLVMAEDIASQRDFSQPANTPNADKEIDIVPNTASSLGQKTGGGARPGFASV